MMKKNQKKSQDGFSIVEALVVAVLTVVVFILAGSFLLGFQRSAVGYNERAKQNEDASLSTQTITSDLERTGANLTLSVKQNFTGEILVPFELNEEYQISDGRIERVSDRSNTALISSVLWHGKGQLKWRGDNFTVSLNSLNQTRQISSENSEITIFENGRQVAYARGISDAAFAIVLSAIVVDGNELCRALYLVDEHSIYESSAPCSPHSQEIAVVVPMQAFLSDMTLNAAEIILRDSGSYPVRMPLLPIYDGNRMSLPFIETDNGFLLLSGDAGRDALFLSRDSSFTEETKQYLLVTDTSDLNFGDMLFICDYLNNRSVLFEVIEVGSGFVQVNPIYKSNMASHGYEKFSTPLADFIGFNFTRGTRIIKLAAPVEYRVAEDGTGLYRRSGNSAWELVLPNVENFSFAQEITAPRIGFEVSFDVMSEGIENQSIAQPVRLSVSPRALNRTFDAR